VDVVATVDQNLSAKRPSSFSGRLAGLLYARRTKVNGWRGVIGGVRGRKGCSGPLSGPPANAMTFDVDSCGDGPLRALSVLRNRPPALAPVLEAVLRPGDCFFEVGANIGAYTLWAAGLVGQTGQVHVFEPVPARAAVLERMVRRNRLEQVFLACTAVGSAVGETGIRRNSGASDLAHMVDGAEADPVAVVTNLDAYAEKHPRPVLVKIDAERVELEVLRGAANLLSECGPALLLGWVPSHPARRRVSQAELMEVLAQAGYQVFNLTRWGLAASGPFSSNVLAMTPQWERFAQVVSLLERTSFPRNQTT